MRITISAQPTSQPEVQSGPQTSAPAAVLQKSKAAEQSPLPSQLKSFLPNPSDSFYRPENPEDYKAWLPGEHRKIKLTSVTVVHPETGTVSSNQTITLADGIIKSVEPTSLNTHLQLANISEWKIVDCDGLYACPGLIECHAHLNGEGPLALDSSGVNAEEPRDSMVLGSSFQLRGLLARGFTTARDVGGGTKAIAQSTETWLVPGPRVFQGGAILSQTGGHGHQGSGAPMYIPGSGRLEVMSGMAWIVDGVPDCLKAAREIMRAGADHIKICTSGGVLSVTDKLTSLQFTVEEISAITTAAMDMGATMVTAHCFTSEAIRRSIAGGIKGIEHGAFLDAETAKLMKENNVFLIPTLAICDLFLKKDLPFNAALNSVQREKMEAVGKAAWDAIKIAEDAGVVVCYGTDLTGGVMSNYSTEEFVSRAAILPSPTVLKQATTNAAKLVNREGLLGIIAPNAYADLLLVSKNPLEDVTILNEPRKYFKGIIKDGRCVMSLVEGLEVEIAI